MKARLLLTSILAGALAASLAVPAVAQENTSRGGVVRLTDATAPITGGTSAWVTVNWTAQNGEATNFQVTAKAANGVTVGYPTNTGDHSSLYWDATLSDSEIDYTALYVSVPSGVSGAEVNLSVSYDWDGRPRTETMAIRVPVVDYDGTPLESLTTDLGEVEADSQNWLELWYTAPGPIVEDVSAVVDGAQFAVTYPGMADSTGLAGDSILASGEKDVARFRLDTTGAGSGAHTLEVSVTYTVGEKSQTLVHKVQVNVLDPAVEPPEEEETDPRTSVRVVDSESSFYWWNDAPTGGDGAWKAAVTFRNDWIRHHYLTLEVSRTHSDGSNRTQTVSDFYVAAESQSTFEAWDNTLTIDGDDRNGVVGVEVRVVSIRTSGENWQTENHETDGPVVSVEAPSAG